MIYWPDWMDTFLDIVRDVPINVAECGACAAQDLAASIIVLFNIPCEYNPVVDTILNTIIGGC